MPVIDYKYRVLGQDDVRRALASISADAKGNAEVFKEVEKELERVQKRSVSMAAQGIAAEALKKDELSAKSLGDAFKAVSRDIDVFAGDAGAKFGRVASDAFGVAEALGTGGVLGAVVGISAAVGIGSLAWNAWKEASTQAAKREAVALKEVADELERISGFAKQALDFNKEGDKSAKDLQETIDLRKKEIELTRVSVTALRDSIEQKRNALKRQLYIDSIEVVEFNQFKEDSERKIQELLTTIHFKGIEARRLEDLRVHALGREDAKKEEEAVKKDQEKFERDKTAAAKAATDREYQRFLWAEGVFRRVEKESRDKRLKDEKEANDEQEEENRQIAKERADKLQEESNDFRVLEEAEEKRQRAIEKTREALERKEEAEKRAMKAAMDAAKQQIIATGVNTVYSVSMYGVGKSVDFVSSELEVFRDINRDNWRDMLAITEDTKAAWAAKAQSALVSLAIESGKMAIFENAEAIKEGALAAGEFGSGNVAGGILHAASGAMHYAASAAYGTIGVGAAVGAGTFAASRGAGGPFKATSSERAMGGGGGGGGGDFPESPRSSGGAGGGGGDRPAQVVVNINNQAGSITPADERRAARTTGRFVARAHQDAFMRREMRG